MTDVTNDTTGPDGKFDGIVVQPVPVASTPAIVSLDTQASSPRPAPHAPEAHHKIGLFRATAISGNDLLASVLYTAGGSVAVAGQLAPVTLLTVSLLLVGLRFVFCEVVTALRVNGGAYSALLNTTTKFAAALGSILSFLSYLATCVVSATSCAIYVKSLASDAPVIPVAIAIIAFFALLVAWGVKDSANVALAMFFTHVGTLAILAVSCLVYVIRHDGNLLKDAWTYSWPDVVSDAGTVYKGNVFYAIFFGVAQGSLGVTGYETTANYVEELKPGVFPKTMRDMWYYALVFNPVIALLSLGVCSRAVILQHPNDLLVVMGQVSAGEWLGKLVAVDAVIVLAGGVLTAYVGVNGLIKRLAMDACLPHFLLAENKWRRTNHYIVLTFFLVSVSLLLALDGDMQILAGVFCLSFLGVLLVFTVACVLLKLKRFTIYRGPKANALHLVLAFVFCFWAFIGNIMLSTKVLQFFVLYFVCAAAVVVFTMNKRFTLRVLTRITPGWWRWLRDRLAYDIAEAQAETAVYFCKTPDAYVMNKAVLYLRKNEAATRITMVHLHGGANPNVVPTFEANAIMINQLYPKLVIDAVAVHGEFNPEMVDILSKDLGVEKNMMFVGCPSSKFQWPLDEFGGVRVITRFIPIVRGEGDQIAVQARENTFSFTSMDIQAVRAARERSFVQA